MGEVFLGTSGWSYKDWVGPFYKTPAESKLAAYSKVFKTAEIDSTFYRVPSRGMVRGWLRYTPSDFIFAAKLPKEITHKGKIDSKVVNNSLSKFCDLMHPLQLDGKLCCLLAQLPPSLKYNATLLEDFFVIVPSGFKLAIEFRHKSWLRDKTWRLLERYNAAYTIVDEPLLPPAVKVTSDIAYVRWHGRGERPWYYYLYDKGELEPWVEKIEEAEKQTEKVFGYFNNHYHGYAVRNCLQFAEIIGKLTKEQTKAKDHVEKYFKEAKAVAEKKMKERSMILTACMPEEIEQMSFERLLGMFMDASRIKRAKGIKDKELKIEEISDNSIKASIRNYHFSADTKNRVMLHDCADWSRCVLSKQFCKHVGKVMMTIPKEKALKIMRRIAVEREKWEFRPYVE